MDAQSSLFFLYFWFFRVKYYPTLSHLCQGMHAIFITILIAIVVAQTPAPQTPAPVTPAPVPPSHVSQASLTLRIVAVFAILIASMLGVTMPEFVSRFFTSRTDPSGSFAYQHIVKLLSALGTGCVIATGFCHIAPDAASDMQAGCGDGFPTPFAIATGTICLLYCLEKEMVFFVERRHAAAASTKNEERAALSRNLGEKEEPFLSPFSPDIKPSPEESDDLERLKVSLVTHIFEAGVAVHSVLIGLAMGLLTKASDVRVLLIALLFHQFCEGTAIGAAVLESRLSRCHTYIMWAIFAFTTPLGVVLGILTERSYGSDQSQSAQQVQGILSSIAFGILIYMGMTDMLPSLFNFQGCGHSSHRGLDKIYLPTWYRILLYALFLLGAGAMVIIANWA